MINNSLVEKAITFASLSLAGKKRYSGELFIDHAKKVASILQKYHVNDSSTLAAAIMHHSLPDGIATKEDIRKEFGSNIVMMLDTLERLRIVKVSETNGKEFAENLRKMFLAMSQDIRIVLIKLADILDNLQTLQFVSKEKQLQIARETIEIFAPLAERLGIGEMKGEMQDLAFPFHDPEGYRKTKKLLHINHDVLHKRLLKIKAQLKQAFDNEGIPFRIESRTKHSYSLYKKLERPEINFDITKVYDVIAFRIVVQDQEQCYKVLDVIHTLWPHMEGYVRDYIAHPKPNGYQSIHTTVFGSGNQPFEIQIRTEQMHEDAEYGVAAHWHYSEQKESGITDAQAKQGFIPDTERLAWVKSLSKWQEDVVDNEEFLKGLKVDFFGQRIFVFTPKGDVKDLPSGATPVDFAYAVHTDIGNRVMGAKVNNKMVALDHALKNGDVVEVILSKDKNKKPSRDWLNFVVTSMAKREIKRVYK